MGAIIEAIATSESRSSSSAASSVGLAADAACQVLSRARRTPKDVGLIVNTGIYRDNNIGEPAMAPLIQHRLEEEMLGRGSDGSGAFSFDISNGACGLLTGIELVSGFVSSGSVERGLVVASDVNATPNVSDFVCAPVGAAVLLARGRSEEGFTAFRSDTYAKYSDRFEAACHWLAEDERIESAPGERHVIRLREAEDYVAQCARAAERSLAGFLDEHSLRLGDIDLIVPSQAPFGFPQAFAAAVTPAVRSRCADIVAGFPDAHTVGPALAIEAALASERGLAARNLLFVAAGSGITVVMALYAKPLAGSG